MRDFLSFFRKPAKQQQRFPAGIEAKQIEPQDGEVTHHDDTEKFIVSGTVSGKELIEKVSAAIDVFIINLKS